MYETIKLTPGEIRSLKRFRSDNDGLVIRGVIERLLDHQRRENETNAANETHRLRVAVTKDLLRILYDAELVTGEVL